jgi:hypothetical protein
MTAILCYYPGMSVFFSVRSVVGLLAVLVPISGVYAADYSTKTPDKMKATHRVESTGCNRLTLHKPRADVAYQPEAEGWAGVPVETVPPALTADDFSKVDVPLNLPLGGYLGGRREEQNPMQRNANSAAASPTDTQNRPSDAYSADLSQGWVQPGRLSVDTKSGGIIFNDKDISPFDPALLDSECNQ